MLFSLIIPVYNVKKFLGKCLASVISQKDILKDDYEIIVIDDGSSDGSGEYAERLLQDIENASVIHQENGGLSAARNRGIATAKGEYIWFIDSDDWISENSLSILKQVLKNHYYPDIIMFRALECDDNGNFNEYVKPYPFAGTNAKSGTEVFLTKNWNTCSPFYLISRHLINRNRMRYMEGVYHEDNEFTPKLLFYAKNVAQINDFLYYRYLNPDSITQVPRLKRATDIIKVCESLNQFYDNEDLLPIHKKRLSSFISMSLNTSYNLIYKYFRDKKSEINDLMNEKKFLFRHLLYSGIKKYQLEYLLFRLTHDYIGIYSFLMKFKNNKTS